MRLLIILYAGDYREAYYRIGAGKDSTYIGHKYNIETISDIAKQIEEVAVLQCKSLQVYNELLEPRFRVIGTGFNPYNNKKKLIQLIAKYQPTHLVIRAPIPEIFRWAIQQKVKTIGILADSFLQKGFKRRIKNYLLGRLFNHKAIDWMANHGLNSCLSLQKIGVNPNKIIPWDLPHVWDNSITSKKLRNNVKRWNLLYVGSVQESKGVGDILEAIAILKEQKFVINLKIAGKGKIEYFVNRAKQLNIENCLDFLGLIPNNAVIPLMGDSDLVLIPSRHEYPEGINYTIYEALQSRTPIVTSDHPMFLGNLEDRVSAMIFPERNPNALAECIEQLMSSPELYYKLSQASYETWQRLQVPVKWGDLIKRWLNNSPEDQQWLFDHRLSSGQYTLNR